MPSLIPPALSLYIHMPWCIQKCPYCDFNSHTQKGSIPETEYISALLADLDHDIARYQLHQVVVQDQTADQNQAVAQISKPRPLHSIFIGGGTPSLFSPAAIAELLDAIKQRFSFKTDIEITMEANPGTIEAERFKQYQQAGITRISIGVQSFEAEKLQRLGRIHNAIEAERAAQLAHQIGLSSFNLDLMHGLPEQTVEQALNDLDKAIQLDPPHLSWYQLTIEANTLFYSQPPSLPDDDQLWTIFEQGHLKLTQAGYQQYEISGYSKVGHQCQHNLNYWRFGDYLGIGCGAHGKLSFNDGRILRTTKVKHPKGYLNPQRAYLDSEILISDEERPFEFFLNRFRLIEACPKQDYIDFTGLPLESVKELITIAVMKGYINETELYWQVTEKGKLFLNDLLAIFA